MLINKWIKEIAKNIAAPSNIRPTLAWLRFSDNKVVATDSFKILEITFDNEKIKEELKGVKIKNFTHSENNDFIIKTEDILALKEPTKMSQDILNNIFVWNITDEQVTLATTNNKNEMLMNTKLLVWNFPNYECFFEWNRIESTTLLEIDHLMGLLKTMKANQVDKIELSITENNWPVYVNSYKKISKYIKNIRSIIMPLKK